MKKIGVVTWFGGSNYGTSLQAYALSHTLNKLGVKPYLLKNHMTWRNVVGQIYRSLRHSNAESTKNGLREDKAYKIKKFRNENFNQFIQCVGYIGKFFYKRQIEQLSCVISGSDQLWNPYHTTPFLLLQGLECKKYSYASSIGVTSIPNDKIQMYKNALSQYSGISARETTAIKPLELVSGKKVHKVLDPTFLLDYNQWSEFVSNQTLKSFDTSTPYILCYFVAENGDYIEKRKEVQRISKINRVITIPMCPSHFDIGTELVEDAGINDFVYLIKNASLVCTDSFHATTISISLKQNFITLLRFKKSDKISQNSRLEDLLSRYKLQDRLFDDVCHPNLNKDIDYTETFKILEADRDESMNYLRNIIANI